MMSTAAGTLADAQPARLLLLCEWWPHSCEESRHVNHYYSTTIAMCIGTHVKAHLQCSTERLESSWTECNYLDDGSRLVIAATKFYGYRF